MSSPSSPPCGSPEVPRVNTVIRHARCMRVSARPYPSPLDVTFSRIVPDGGLEQDIIIHQDTLLESIDNQVISGLYEIDRQNIEGFGNRQFASINEALGWIIDEADRRQNELDNAEDKLWVLTKTSRDAYRCTTKKENELAIDVTVRLKRAIRDVRDARGASKNFDTAYAIAVQICEAIEALIPPIDLTTNQQQ